MSIAPWTQRASHPVPPLAANATDDPHAGSVVLSVLKMRIRAGSLDGFGSPPIATGVLSTVADPLIDAPPPAMM